MLRAVKTIRVQVCKTTKTYRDGWTRSILSVIYSTAPVSCETYTTFCVFSERSRIGYYPTFFCGSSVFSGISSLPKRCDWKKNKTLTARRAGIRSRSFSRSFFYLIRSVKILGILPPLSYTPYVCCPRFTRYTVLHTVSKYYNITLLLN